MERLGWWLCAGLAMLGLPGSAAAGDVGGAADAGNGGFADVDSVPQAPGALRESHITYPLEVDGWHAVGEHHFDDQAHGVCVRFTHGDDTDRWIDLYFYPAGPLSPSQFMAAAREEADLIRQAHLQAGHAAFDMGSLQPFAAASTDARTSELPGQALDLAFTSDDVAYSSAMTLLLDRMHFIKARFSIRAARLTRREAREQLQAFTACLQRRVRIVPIGAGIAAPAMVATAAPAPARAHGAGMREIRLDYGVGAVFAGDTAAAGAEQASAS